MSDIKNLVRENIRELVPYASARDTFEIDENSDLILLDANENPYKNLEKIALNRYPDPKQKKLRTKISRKFGVGFENVICGNGSDELIDLLVRIFCEPKQDSILICPPTFGVYKVCAGVQDIAVENIDLIEFKNDETDLLTSFEEDKRKGCDNACDNDASAERRYGFRLNVEEIIKSEAKLCFIPQPAAPTGGAFERNDLIKILENFRGILVIDEAYMDFYNQSFINEIKKYSKLVVLRTFSKYWGLAGARIGMAFANIEIINYLTAVKAPYNLNVFSQKKAIEALDDFAKKEDEKLIILQEREKICEFLNRQKWVKKIYDSETNFLFIEIDLSTKIYDKCVANKIILRKFGYDNRKFLRISIGTEDENLRLKEVLGNVN